MNGPMTMTIAWPARYWGLVVSKALEILKLSFVITGSLDTVDPWFDFLDESRTIAPRAPNAVIEGVQNLSNGHRILHALSSFGA